jgi:hypothetical protein
MPAQAGTQTSVNKTAVAVRSERTTIVTAPPFDWIPACAGMTLKRSSEIR